MTTTHRHSLLLTLAFAAVLAAMFFSIRSGAEEGPVQPPQNQAHAEGGQGGQGGSAKAGARADGGDYSYDGDQAPGPPHGCVGGVSIGGVGAGLSLPQAMNLECREYTLWNMRTRRYNDDADAVASRAEIRLASDLKFYGHCMKGWKYFPIGFRYVPWLGSAICRGMI